VDLLKSIKSTDIREQTPIELALCIDEDEMTIVKKLYEFLDLEKAHYARWCKKNIIDKIKNQILNANLFAYIYCVVFFIWLHRI